MMFFLNTGCDIPANNGYLEKLSCCISFDDFFFTLQYHYHIYNIFVEKVGVPFGKIFAD
jgi:hypothetical protein